MSGFMTSFDPICIADALHWCATCAGAAGGGVGAAVGLLAGFAATVALVIPQTLADGVKAAASLLPPGPPGGIAEAARGAMGTGPNSQPASGGPSGGAPPEGQTTHTETTTVKNQDGSVTVDTKTTNPDGSYTDTVTNTAKNHDGSDTVTTDTLSVPPTKR